jgi:hypothetical protein
LLDAIDVAWLISSSWHKGHRSDEQVIALLRHAPQHMSTKGPNRLRKLRFATLLITVAVLVVTGSSAVAWRIGLAYRVSSRLRALKTNGLPTSGQELNQWRVLVPDEQNAALVLTQAFSLMVDYPDIRSNKVARLFRLNPPRRKQPLTAEQVELLAGHVHLNEPALARAQEAFHLPNSRYPADCSLGCYTPLPHLNAVRDLVRVAQAKGYLTADSGDLRGAVGCVDAILGLARSLDDEPIVISQVLRNRSIKLAMFTLERILNRGSPEERELEEVASAFAAADRTNLMARALIGERAFNLPYFRMSLAEANRMTDSEENSEAHPAEPPLPGKQAAWVRLTGFFDRDMCYFLDVMETNIVLAALPPPENLVIGTNFETATRTAMRRYYGLSGALFSAFPRIGVSEATALAEARVARMAATLERFRQSQGRLPETLNELMPRWINSIPTDPFDGAPLRYHPLTNGFVIYSIGEDRSDDGGRQQVFPAKPTDKCDITLTVER